MLTNNTSTFSVCLMLIAILLTPVANAIERHELKAALIYNFSQQISWPDENDQTLTIAVAGDQRELFQTLYKGLNGKALRTMTLRIIQSDNPENVASPGIIVSAPSKKDNSDLLRLVQGKALLLITDGQLDKNKVMINIISTAAGTLSFEINRPNILKERLKIGADILLLGGTELDVVDLFEKTEQALLKSQSETETLAQQLNEANARLSAINQEITQKERTLDVQKSKLGAMESAVNQRLQELNIREQSIQDLDAKIQQLTDAAKETQAFAKQSSELAEQALLEAHESDLLRTRAEQDFANVQALIINRQTQLEALSSQLSASTTTTALQKDVIDQQRTLLTSLGVALILVAGLLIQLTNHRRKLVKSQQALEQKNIELQGARLIAEKANITKSQFLATMSHEIRTPMNAIIGMAEILRNSQLPPKEHEYNEIIRSAGIGLLSILNDILDFSKMEAGKMEVSHEPFNLVKLIADIEKIFHGAANQKGLKIYSSIEKNVPTHVIGDPQRIRQMLINLINNALKFTAKGHISISVRRVDLDQLAISVSDTGIGMAPDNIDRLFQEFVQVGSNKEKQGGTGLGLAICKKLSTLMGGDISVISNVNQGSTFTLELHLPECSEEDIKDLDLSPAALNNKKLLIWIAEDNTVNQKVIVGLLDKMGHHSRVFNDGQEIVTAYQQDQSANLIFMDCEMPVLNGWDATRAIRQFEQEHSLTPAQIMALTAHALEEFNQKSTDSGMNGILHKPLTMQSLARCINRAIVATAEPLE